jgi:DsbC/DsbD-like thiol-disulfide interchange protein
VTPFLFAVLVWAQAPSAPAVVSVTSPAPAKLAPGARAEVRFSVTVKKGFHVQANPASEPYLVPLRLEMKSDSRVRIAKTHYPPGKPWRLTGTEQDLSTYDGTFEIRLDLEAAPQATPGEVTLSGTLHYQACDDRVCLRPASVPVSLAVSVSGSEKPDSR